MEGLRADSPPDSKVASDEVSQLVVQLPQAKNATEVFSLFAEHVALLFGGLLHISILLLPKESPGSSSASNANTQQAGGSTNNAKPAGGSQKGRGKDAGGGRPSAKQQQQPKPAQPPPEPTSKHKEPRAWEQMASDSGVRGLDWSNCCIFQVVKGRGPIVQSPPAWPLACTATYHSGVVTGEVLTTPCYSERGPHFLDWAQLHAKGAQSMVAVPLFSCNQATGVLCLASSQTNAFQRLDLVKLLASILAPYVLLLEYTTRRMEMQKLVNEIITPIAAQLAQQKQSQLSRLGCSVEEDTSLDAAADKKRPPSTGAPPFDNLKATQSLKVSCSSSLAARRSQAAAAARAVAASARQPTLAPAAAPAAVPATGKVAAGAGAAGTGGRTAAAAAKGVAGAGVSAAVEPAAVGKQHTLEVEQLAAAPDMDLDWGDFFFNLVSMCIVYVYFSKAAVAGESLVAILLCMGVAAFDIVLLIMRWLWFEHYIHYGNLVLHVFQIYRVVVLPVANTWMSWSLINKMDFKPSLAIVALLGLLLLCFVALGIQVRFFLHAPLQLASVLFAATSTSDLCGALFGSTSSLACIGAVSLLQLSLGLLLPALMVWLLEARSGRTFLPHVQAKRWLLHP